MLQQRMTIKCSEGNDGYSNTVLKMPKVFPEAWEQRGGSPPQAGTEGACSVW